MSRETLQDPEGRALAVLDADPRPAGRQVRLLDSSGQTFGTYDAAVDETRYALGRRVGPGDHLLRLLPA